MSCGRCHFLVTLATSEAPTVTPLLDRVPFSVITRIKDSLMETAVATTVRVVVVIVTASWIVAGIDRVTIRSLYQSAVSNETKYRRLSQS